MSELLDEAVAAAVEVMREYRDHLPTVPAVSCYCGNITGPHNNLRCGTPSTVWCHEAWEIEFRARDLEAAHKHRTETSA